MYPAWSIKFYSSSLSVVWSLMQLLTEEEHQRFLELRLSIAESRSEHSFHCQTPNCRGWCIYEDEVDEFLCDICKETNCILCRVTSSYTFNWRTHCLFSLLFVVVVESNKRDVANLFRPSTKTWIVKTTKMTCESEQKTTKQLNKLSRCSR